MPECVQSSSHRGCDSEQCKVERISNLESCLEMFLNELSKVFFKKSNLRSKSWWLSAFYSFCIHSIVRRGLLILVQTRYKLALHETTLCSPCSVADNYLVVALRFFVATSGMYDPLTIGTNSPEIMTSETKTSPELISEEHFKIAQKAVKQETWKSYGISGSMQYLQTLYQDNEEVLPPRRLNSETSETDGYDFAEFQLKLLREKEFWERIREMYAKPTSAFSYDGQWL
jgi:hypothetical protein